MAIAFDAATTRARVGSGSNSFTYSHTCSGSDRILFVGVTVVNPSGNTATGVTYNGAAMTKIATAAAQSNVLITLWCLVNPASGSNTISVSTASNIGAYADSLATSYSGASDTGQPDAFDFSNGTSTTISESVTTTVDDCWTVAVCWSNGNPAASTGSTSRSEVSDRTMLADSNSPITSAGLTTMNFTAGIPDNYGIVMASFAPAGAAPDPAQAARRGAVMMM